MIIPSNPLSTLLSINNFIQNNFFNRITINIDNSQSRNTLHHGRCILGIGNKLIKPLPVTINRREMGSIESKSIIKKSRGIITYEIGEKCKDNLPLLIVVGWKENGNTGTNTFDFEAYSMTIDGSINDG
ncbi:hypothetical protein GLOIN_2v1788316 [Rhizophagus clarus]|uniref:Uncharacterized protein n=1 Tax=Rhizophagus clarus TaxID=94130 RepID=A0A8H3QT78_9GLOM|nr:hypothetical protein GLOIN_2v1788316 [Rhizophagus clarus]